MRRIGFALIELLAVVAIISLLIAIMVPAMKQARAQAHEVVCRSNHHQIHVAIEAYAHDSKGFYPLADFEINPHRKLIDALRADKTGLMDAFYCPQYKVMEPVAQNTTDYPPKGKSTSVTDTPENRELGNVSYFYWSMKDRSSWRSTNHKKWDEPMDSFRPRWLRNGGLPIPLQPSDPQTPCALQKERPGGPGGYWVLSDFFRKKATFPHHRKHKSGLNVLYLDGHADWMFGQPRANFK
ncbi:MAG: type II secretion system protein [Planctomycetota bacterium]|nr:MAG: type II secretion system protein [Planctomycetota bacterium]